MAARVARVGVAVDAVAMAISILAAERRGREAAPRKWVVEVQWLREAAPRKQVVEVRWRREVGPRKWVVEVQWRREAAPRKRVVEVQ